MPLRPDPKKPRELKLPCGKIALIDEEDAEHVMKFKWHYNALGYVARGTTRTGIAHTTLHRFVTDAPKGMEVDHINHNGLDNRKMNLRVCTRSENMANRRQKGWSISSRNKANPFISAICKDGKRRHLGYFPTAEAAAEAYHKARRELFGDFAYVETK